MKKYMIGYIIMALAALLLACSSNSDEIRYEVVFESLGAGELEAIELEKGDPIPIPDVTKEGYTLEGWYTSINDGETFDEKWSFYSDTVIQDVTLYAKWIAEVYHITYILDGGINGSNPSIYTTETETIYLENPIKDGYTFDGWYDNPDLSGFTTNRISKGSTGDKTFYAKWKVNFDIGLVTDTGGINDKAFNQGTWNGILRFAEDYNLPEGNRRYLQSSSDADYIPNISAFADEQLDLIVMPGFLFDDALKNVSENYPEQNFLIIDSFVDADNVASAIFTEPKGSFLVGVAAALKAQDAGEDTVGFIGGGDFPLIHGFEAGYAAGVHAVDPDMTVLVDYVGDFVDAGRANALADKQYDQGAYAIYHVAGGAGTGAISEAKSRRINGEDVWVIGVEIDQYEEGIYNDDDDSAILTSMVKRVDVAAYDVAVDTLNNEFPGGQVLVFDLENNGVGLPDDNPNLSAEILAKIAEYRDDIIAGIIFVPTVPERLKG